MNLFDENKKLNDTHEIDEISNLTKHLKVSSARGHTNKNQQK